MKIGMTFKNATKCIAMATIVAISTIAAGCHPVMDAVVRSKLGVGFNSEAPQVSSITSYPTNDPELKIYLSYLGALENDLLEIRGKVMDTKAFEAQQKDMEAAVRKGLDDSPLTLSAEEKFAMAERSVEGQLRMGPPNYLKLLPPGADPKASTARIHKAAEMRNEDVERKVTTISVGFKFRSAQEMSRKAHEIVNKLRPVFATQQGWKFQDPAALRKQAQENEQARQRLQSTLRKRRVKPGVSSETEANPEIERKLQEWNEKNQRLYDAGQAMIQYFWNSGYRNQNVAVASTPAQNLMMINIFPTLEPKNGYYHLSVSFTRSMVQPKNK